MHPHDLTQMQMQMHSEDPTVDRQDGARSIEITAMFDTSVLAVRHLDNPRAGRVAAATWALLAIAAGTVAAGVAFAAGGQGGFGGLMLALGMGTGVFALLRVFDERRSPNFVLGDTPDADLPLVHQALPAQAFPLVRSTGDDYELLLTAGMAGDVTVGADRYELQGLIAEGRAKPVAAHPGCFALPLPQRARAYLHFGDHAFLVASVATARQVATPLFGSLRWSTQVFTGLSFAAHAALLMLVFATPPDAKALSLDMFKTDNKFVQYAIKPKTQDEDKVPAWMLHAQLADKKQGDRAGRRHAGKEGKAGKREAPRTGKRYAMKGTALNPQMSKTLAERTARTSGILGLLNSRGGSTVASIFGSDHALGADALDAMGGLLGDEQGEDYGVGGLGLTDSGRGGGGDGLDTLGLSTIGTIGHGDGTDGRYGGDVAPLRRRKPRMPKIGAGVASVRGALDKELIRRVVRRHLKEVRYCYQRELQSNAKLAGRLVVQFTIRGNGTVMLSRVQSSTLKSSTVERCVANAVRRWSFPKPQGGGIVIVSYPFRFHPAGASR